MEDDNNKTEKKNRVRSGICCWSIDRIAKVVLKHTHRLVRVDCFFKRGGVLINKRAATGIFHADSLSLCLIVELEPTPFPLQ